MRLVQTRNKRFVFGVLLSVLVVCVGLTIGQIPLAVSQPVTIPVGKIAGAIPMDAAHPVWESVPGIVVPLSGQTITTPMHPNISVKTVMIKMATNGKEIGLWANWGDQTLNDTTIGPQDFRAFGHRRSLCARVDPRENAALSGRRRHDQLRELRENDL